MLNGRVVSTIYTHMYMCMYCNSVSLLYRDTRFCLVLGLKYADYTITVCISLYYINNIMNAKLYDDR